MRKPDLMRVLCSIPIDHYVKIGAEVNPETGDEFLAACVFQRCPPEGWATRAERFGHEPGPNPEPAGVHAFDDRVIYGVSASRNDPASLERLLIASIRERWSP